MVVFLLISFASDYLSMMYKTIIIRHRRENLKKCSLYGLESRDDLHFLTYPTHSLPLCLDNHTLLTLDAPPLTSEDGKSGLILLDATWRLAQKMEKTLGLHLHPQRRSLPPLFRTAYPRRQEDCPSPMRGLASIEALTAAYSILGWETKGLLDHYYWKTDFLQKNPHLLSKGS